MMSVCLNIWSFLWSSDYTVLHFDILVNRLTYSVYSISVLYIKAVNLNNIFTDKESAYTVKSYGSLGDQVV